MPNETRLDVAKPGPFAINASRVRTNNAAPTTSVKVKAICAVTITFRSRTPPNAVPPRSRSDDTKRTPPCLPGRSQAAQNARRHTCDKREKQETRVDARVQSGGGRSLGKERDKSSHGKRSRCDPEQSPGKRDQQAVGKKLPPKPPARSAQRQPCADLTIASRSARQEQTGDIQTGQSPTTLPSQRTAPTTVPTAAASVRNGPVAPQ